MNTRAVASNPELLALPRRLRGTTWVRGALSSRSGKVGVALLALVVAIGLFGPFFAPYSPTEVVGAPFQAPSSSHWLGTDALGRDAFSRFLDGGRTLLIVVAVSTVLAYVIGVLIGMAAGYLRGMTDLLTVGAADLIISFPPIVFVLLLLAGAGSGLAVLVVAIAAVQIPRVARITRTCTLEVASLEYVEAAVARGESRWAILRRDILPNISTPLLADFGLRLTASVILFTSVSYLGLGPAPPSADWGLTISDNRAGLLVQPWCVIAPAVAIATLAVSVNLVADAIARSSGRSLVSRGV